jgi:hypothetical protein
LFDRPKPTAGCSANGRRRLAGVKVNYQSLRNVWKKTILYQLLRSLMCVFQHIAVLTSLKE